MREHISRRRTFISYSVQGAIMADQRESSWTYPNKEYDRTSGPTLDECYIQYTPNEKRKRKIPFIRVSTSRWCDFSRAFILVSLSFSFDGFMVVRDIKTLDVVLSCLEIRDF